MSNLTEPSYMSWARDHFGGPRTTPAEPRARNSAPAQDRHPVLAALPPDVRLAVYRRGHLRDVEAGESLGRGGGVQFVLTGALGLFPMDGSGICLRVVGPGAVVNAEELAGADARRDVRVLVRGALLALRGGDLAEIIGRDRADQLVIDQMLAEQAALDQEVTCNALHLAPARLARWLLRLDEAAGGADIRITQAQLADMLGVQRTSVNAAARCLHGEGGLRFVRGRVRILDPAVLAKHACGCSAATRRRQKTASPPGAAASA